MSNNLVKDLDLVLIECNRDGVRTEHYVGWVLVENKDYVLIVTEFVQDPGNIERCGFDGMKKIMKDDIKYRRPIDRDVNMDVVNPFVHDGGGIESIPDGLFDNNPYMDKISEGLKYHKIYHKVGEKPEATDLLIGDVTRQQAKYERWWLHRVPVEINGKELNPGHFKIVNVDYRVNLKNKGEVKIILQDLNGYIIEAKEGKPYPKKSQVKLLEELKG